MPGRQAALAKRFGCKDCNYADRRQLGKGSCCTHPDGPLVHTGSKKCLRVIETKKKARK